MDRLFTPRNKELNTDTCQLRDIGMGGGKFQCIVSVTPAGEAELGICEPGPACGNAALPDDPCQVLHYFTTTVEECGWAREAMQ